MLSFCKRNGERRLGDIWWKEEVFNTLTNWTQVLALYDQQVWLIGMQTQTYETVYSYCYETNLSIYHCSLKLQKENRISSLQKGKFRRPSSAPEARKERSCQSYFASHIKWRAERSFHPPTFIRPWHERSFRASGTLEGRGNFTFCKPEILFPFCNFRLQC